MQFRMLIFYRASLTSVFLCSSLHELIFLTFCHFLFINLVQMLLCVRKLLYIVTQVFLFSTSLIFIFNALDPIQAFFSKRKNVNNYQCFSYKLSILGKKDPQCKLYRDLKNKNKDW